MSFNAPMTHLPKQATQTLPDPTAAAACGSSSLSLAARRSPTTSPHPKTANSWSSPSSSVASVWMWRQCPRAQSPPSKERWGLLWAGMRRLRRGAGVWEGHGLPCSPALLGLAEQPSALTCWTQSTIRRLTLSCRPCQATLTQVPTQLPPAQTPLRLPAHSTAARRGEVQAAQRSALLCSCWPWGSLSTSWCVRPRPRLTSSAHAASRAVLQGMMMRGAGVRVAAALRKAACPQQLLRWVLFKRFAQPREGKRRWSCSWGAVLPCCLLQCSVQVSPARRNPLAPLIFAPSTPLPDRWWSRQGCSARWWA